MKWRLRVAFTLAAVILLAAGGALVGLKVRGVVGLLLGAVLGALAGVAAGYVPGIRDRARQRATERAVAVARLRAAGEPELEIEGDPGPSVWLRPERAVVTFTGREAELAGLRTWCESAQGRSVLVLVGAGGVGKTRLALELSSEWRRAGRQSLLVAAEQEAGALAAIRDVASSGPVLLVVDYAETRARLGDLLREVLDDPGPVRVLLLARSLGEWWDRLVETCAPAVAALLKEQQPMRLDAPIVAEVPDAELAASAVPFFAARLGAPVPAKIAFMLPERRVPVLVLHAAALVAVLRTRTASQWPTSVAVSEAVLGELLVHEARYWRRTAAAAGLPDDGAALKAVVAAAILLGAADLPEAARVAGRIPDLAGEPEGRLRRWGRWMYGLYPAGSDGRLGSVQPDLLAEHHVVTQLAADPAVAAGLLQGLTAGQATQALTVLARAWALDDRAGQVIEAALRADLAGLAVAACGVAVQTRNEVGNLLGSALADGAATIGELRRIAQALPYPSVALADADAVVTQRIRGELPPGTEPWIVAEWADRAGVRLLQVRRPADALTAELDAVAGYRDLALAMPDSYRPGLAQSLDNLGICYRELGRRAEALPPTEEAVGIRRELAIMLPDRYLPDLAQSLHSLGIRFHELGRPAEAIPPTQEAVAIRRELAARMPDRHRVGLSGSLNNLSLFWLELGRLEDALLSAQEAVAIRRELAAAMPDQHSLDLLVSLSNLGLMLSELGRADEALLASQEAVEVGRHLSVVMPDRYLPELAISLNNLGADFEELGRPAEALRPVKEAVAVFRGLVAVMPDRYRPELSASLIDLGGILLALGHYDEALPAVREAVAIRRELATSLPGRYRSDLAYSLRRLGVALSGLDRDHEALPAAQEAVTIYQELTAAIPERYRPDLVDSLHKLSGILSALGRDDEAASVRRQAEELGEPQELGEASG